MLFVQLIAGSGAILVEQYDDKTEQSELYYGDAEGIAAVGATVPVGRLAAPRDIGDASLFFVAAGFLHLRYHAARARGRGAPGVHDRGEEHETLIRNRTRSWRDRSKHQVCRSRATRETRAT